MNLLLLYYIIAIIIIIIIVIIIVIIIIIIIIIVYYCLLLERLADSLRLPQVIPSIQAQVFLCFRVLLLRMSPQHATSLWPVIVSELVQVFLYIEQELNADSEEFR